MRYNYLKVYDYICKSCVLPDHHQGGTAGVAPDSAAEATLQQPENAARRMAEFILLLSTAIKPKHKS